MKILHSNICQTDPQAVIDPQSLPQILHKKAFLQLMRTAYQINRLRQILPDILPAELVSHCDVLNVREKTLILAVDNASYAVMLRYNEAEWLLKIRKKLPKVEITKIQIRVRPGQP